MPAGPIETSPRGAVSPEQRRAVLLDAQAAAGVPVGTYDVQVIEWLAGWDWPIVATIASWLRSAAIHAEATEAGVERTLRHMAAGRVPAATHEAVMSVDATGCWRVFVTTPARTWPEYVWQPDPAVPTLAARHAALAGLGFEPVPGAVWEWQEDDLDAEEDPVAPVRLLAAIPVQDSGSEGVPTCS
ncbi:DUF6303 family protein [Streptomyces marincola]|nr:DUF6303 family protein [Streptomyces marincola]